MSTMSSEVQVGRGRRQLVMLALLFLAPVVSAWLVWNYLSTGGPAATTNAGQLVQPARTLEAVALKDASGDDWSLDEIRGRWAYVMFASGSCDARCEQQLYYTRQIRIGINKDMQRLHRLLVLAHVPDATWLEQLVQEHPDLTVLVANGGTWQAFAGQFQQDNGPVDGSRFYMVDPLGNLMMSYDENVTPKGIDKDLRKLLKVSQIG